MYKILKGKYMKNHDHMFQFLSMRQKIKYMGQLLGNFGLGLLFIGIYVGTLYQLWMILSSGEYLFMALTGYVIVIKSFVEDMKEISEEFSLIVERIGRRAIRNIRSKKRN